MPPTKRPKSGKRRRKKRKQDERRLRIRNTLIGAGLVMGTFITVGVVALHELQLEEAERQRALLAAVQQTAARPTPPPRDSISATSDPAHPARKLKLSDLRLGLPDSKIKAMLGAPDLSMSDHRFRYTSLGLELKYRPVGGGLQLESISFSSPGAPPEAMGELNLPGLEIGGPPDALKAIASQGRIVFNRSTQSYTLYLPGRNLAIDFTPQAIQAVRIEQGIKDRLTAALSGPHGFEVSFDQAFSAETMFGQRLTDAQFDTTVKKAGSGNAPIHTISMRLKVDQFNPDDLREAIKRRINSQVAGGDVAAAVTVLARNGSKIVECDWYSPRYTDLTGTQPQRFGAVDSTDNISYRWY